ncbi:MAG: methyltransferase domain-containing protein [Nitrospirae bacterium]|nr:methyltransferase domain-containing protein [Nitrospirota bacterium]
MDNKMKDIVLGIWDNPNELLLAEFKKKNWTSHNIPLTRTISTMGDAVPLIGNDRRMQIIKNTLRFLKKGELSGLKLIDLGCLEGGLSFEMACEGINVVGVEGRVLNYEKCVLLKNYYSDLSNLNFICSDVKKLSKNEHGVFDIVLCCGLLYHLDNPMSFIDILDDITHDDSILFLDTHIAPSDMDLDSCIFKNDLSHFLELKYNNISYEGRWYDEYSKEANGSDNEWAAVSNPKSFWLSFDSLVKSLYYGGFRRIYNMYGGFDIEQEFELRKKYSRLYCFATKNNII